MAEDLSVSPRVFTPKEIAERWKVSDETVKRIFLLEPGVMRIQRCSIVLLRIPEGVLLRLERRMTVPEGRR